jgi:exodeoxyribonuclease-3
VYSQPVKLATWNVNSVRARQERVLAWFDRHQPDIACLQELKCQDEEFPLEAFTERGYRLALFGQKTYNGVAIAAKAPLELADVTRGMVDGVDDQQARVIGATVGDLRVLSLYCPNGQSVGSEKYAYKLAWFERVRAMLARELAAYPRTIVAGDFNVAPGDADVYDPVKWGDAIMCSPREREALQALVSLGLEDVLRRVHPEGQFFTWWDYRMLSFPKGKGLRIDHVLATPPVAAQITSCVVDRESRKGKQPSDHAPVIVELAA